MYIIVRRNDDILQMLYDRFQIDGSGEWRAPGEGAIDIQLQFPTYKDAAKATDLAIQEEPWWDYEIREYLR